MVLQVVQQLSSSLPPLWICLLGLFLVAAVAIVYLLIPTSESVLWYPSESEYVDPKKGNKKVAFAGAQASPEVELTIIAPAYDESKRLPSMLDATMKYLQNRKKETPSFSYEVIVVDDGSRDNTTDVALEYVTKYGTENVRVLTLHKNRGKGGAVKRGMLVGRGRYLLFADADGATDINDLGRVLATMKKTEKNGLGIVIGSRAHLVEDVVAKRSFLRNVLMYGFHILVVLAGVPKIRDTQCGFKMFSRKAAHMLFSNMHIERWAFDVELLYLAHVHGIPVVEEAVNWREIEGSKLSPFASSVQMAIDLARIRLRYLFGVWKVQKGTKRD